MSDNGIGNSYGEVHCRLDLTCDQGQSDRIPDDHKLHKLKQQMLSRLIKYHRTMTFSLKRHALENDRLSGIPFPKCRALLKEVSFGISYDVLCIREMHFGETSINVSYTLTELTCAYHVIVLLLN